MRRKFNTDHMVGNYILQNLNLAEIYVFSIHRFWHKLKAWGSNVRQVKSEQVLPTAGHHCYISSKGDVLPTAGTMMRKWVPKTRHTLWRNTASVMQDLIWTVGCFFGVLDRHVTINILYEIGLNTNILQKCFGWSFWSLCYCAAKVVAFF